MSGVSLHIGREVKIKVCPAPAKHGVKFLRTDVLNQNPIVEALYSSVSDTKFSTKISNKPIYKIHSLYFSL